jgi:hypothetical protein
VTGVVAEDGRPVADAGILIEIDGTEAGAGETTTTADGHYQVTLNPPHEATLWGKANKAGYLQQCAARTTVIGASATLDIRLTSITNLSMARPMSDPGSRTVSGIVFETTPTGPRPVQGVDVGWSAFFDEGAGMANTVTDSSGFYLLCNLPQTRIVSSDIYDGGLFAGDSPAPVIDAGTSDVVMNIELKHPSSSSVRRVFKIRR